LRRVCKAELEPEFAAYADGALHADGAAHHLDEAFGHHQADARALLGAGFLAEAIEWLEQLSQL
jgi:hypothetical protein